MLKTARNAPSAVEAEDPAGTPSSMPAVDLAVPVWRVVLLLALPALAQQLLYFGVMLSDRVLAGRLKDEHAAISAVAPEAFQSAQTTANYLVWLISSYTVLVGVGSTALVARFTGAGNRAGATHATNQALLLATALGLGGTVLGLVGLEHVLEWLQLNAVTAGVASSYLRPILLALTFQILEQAGIACLVGAGDTRTGMWVMIGVVLVNIVLAWGFFLGVGPLPRLGFVGIAVGTALSHTLGGLAILAVLARGRAGLQLVPQLLWPDRELLWRLLRVSVPAGIDSLSQSLGHLCFLSVVNRLGDVAGSAHGIALIWESVAFLSAAAFGIAAMSLVGQNLGAGQPRRAAQSGWTALGLGCALMCLEAVIFFTFAQEMFRFICPDEDQRAIVEAGVPVLRLVAFAVPAMACCMILQYALRGAGDTRVPVLITLVGLFAVRLPLAYVLTVAQVDLGSWGTWPGGELGLRGAWVAMFVDLVVRGCFFLLRFGSNRWQTTRV